MAIGFRGAGSVGNSTTDPATSPGMPAGFLAGDMHILVVGSKAATPPTLVTPTGWNAPLNNTTTGGAGAAGIDTGPNRVTLCWRIAQAGDTGPTIDLSAAGSPTQAVILGFTKNADESWLEVFTAVAADTTGSTTLYDPAAAAVTLNMRGGDWLGVADAINGDAGTPTLPGTLTVSGVTFDSLVNRLNAGTNTGNDGRLIADTAPYISGAASAGPDRSITYTGANASMAGASVFFVLSVAGSGKLSRLFYPGRGPFVKWYRFRETPLYTYAPPILFGSKQETATSTASWVATLPPDVAQGNGLLAFIISGDNTQTITVNSTPSGWATVPGTANPQDNSGVADIRTWLYYKVAGESESNPTWGFTGAHVGQIIIARYTGVSTSNPIDTANGQGTATGGTHATPSITPSIDHCRIVGFAGIDKSATQTPYWTPPGGWDERSDFEDGVEFTEGTFADLPQLVAAPISGTFTSNDSDAGSTYIVALRPAGEEGPAERIITAGGISSDEAFGNANTASISVVDVHGITSAEAVGNATVTSTYTIQAHGISSSESLGNTQVTSTIDVPVHGIPSAETFGNPNVTVVTAINANGIPSSEAVGNPAITTTYTIQAHGITSDERLGNANVATASTINAHGIASAEAVGNVAVTSTYTIQAHGIPSSERLGNANVATISTVTAHGIPTSERLGNPSITVITAINAGSIHSEEKFGAATVTSTYTITAHGIPSAERLGNANVASVSIIAAGGITSAEQFGAASVVAGPVTIAAGGIASSERVGNPDIQIVVVGLIQAGSITSSETFGSPFVGPPMYVDVIYRAPSSYVSDDVQTVVAIVEPQNA